MVLVRHTLIGFGTQFTSTHAVTPSSMLANTSSQDGVNSTWIPNSDASFHVIRESQNIHKLGQARAVVQSYY